MQKRAQTPGVRASEFVAATRVRRILFSSSRTGLCCECSPKYFLQRSSFDQRMHAALRPECKEIRKKSEREISMYTFIIQSTDTDFTKHVTSRVFFYKHMECTSIVFQYDKHVQKKELMQRMV